MIAEREINWDAIELEYRAGILTLREIANEHSITHGAVNKRAKRDGWTRDLAASIKNKVDELVSSATVSKLKVLTGLERQAYNLDAVDAQPNSAPALPEKPLSPYDAARRIAFVLAKGLKHSAGAGGASSPAQSH